MDDFANIVGSGGFGLVVAHNKKNIVAKFLYESKCADAEKEFKVHSDIYQAFEIVKRQNPAMFSQISIPEPLGYDDEIIIKFGNVFNCYYIMSRLKTINSKGLYHIVKDSIPMVNKEIGRVYSEPVSAQNPSRGFFASYEYIQTNILDVSPKRGKFKNIDDIIRSIGRCFGTIAFIAEYNPQDIEYTLGIMEDQDLICLCVLDFGAVRPINFSPDAIDDNIYNKKLLAISRELEDNIDIDIYFPEDEDRLRILIEGIEDAVSLVKSTDAAYKEKWIVFRELKRLIKSNF